MKTFGEFIKDRREELGKSNRLFSQRQLSKRIGIESSYLSKIERGLPATLSEEKILLLAKELQVDEDYLLALGGKISSDVQEVIRKRPKVFSRLIREVQNMPDEAIEIGNGFTGIVDALNNLHSIASIGSYCFSSDPKKSYWTNQVITTLEIDPELPPTIDNALLPFGEKAKAAYAEAEKESKLTGNPLHIELSFESDKGATKHVAIWGYTEKDPASGVESRSGIIQDISSNAEMRKEINEANEALKSEVHQQSRTISQAIQELKSEIAQKENVQKELAYLNEEMAQKAIAQNQAFKEVAFQIRALASQIVSKAVIDDKGDSELNQKLSEIILKVDNLGELITDGLSESNEQFDLQKLIENNVETINTAQGEKGIVFMQAPGLPQYVVGDRPRISRILAALMELVFEITAWGNMQVTAKLMESDTPELVVIFYTSSASGPLAEEDFFPGDNTNSTLGMENPVRWVGPAAKNLGGHLTVSTPSDEEVSIRLSLPVEQAEATEETPRPTPKSDNSNRILIVEDDPYNRLYLEKGLGRHEEYVLDAVATGGEALERLNNQEYGLILLDIQLPDISGVDVAIKVRQGATSNNADLPILAVTAHVDPSQRKHYKEIGMNDVLAKPFKLPEALEKIKDLLC